MRHLATLGPMTLLALGAILSSTAGTAFAQGTCLGAPSIGIACDGSDSRSNDLSDLVETTPCSAVNNYPGGEVTYEFMAPRTENVTVDLSNIVFAQGDPDLFVLTTVGEDSCGACVAESTNVGATPEQIVFAATEGQTYYFMVNGFTDGVTGTYTIDVACGGGGGGGACDPVGTLACGGEDSRSNDGLGSTDQLDAYACGELNGFDYSGPEVAYTFVAPRNETVTATLTDPTNVLDLAVLQDQAGQCDAGGCLDGTVIDGGTAVVELDVVQGQTYYVVVDGFQGGIANYTVALACEGGTGQDPLFSDGFETGDTSVWSP